MKFDQAKLTVLLDFGDREYGQTIIIDGPMMESFMPLDVCSDRTTQAIYGTAPSELRRQLLARPDYAATLSRALADLLLKSMRSRDLQNGYPKEPK